MSDWRDLAACQDTDPEVFYPGQGDGTFAARAICRRCPVVTACLNEALDLGDQHGVWGALSPEERKNLRRRERRSGTGISLRGQRR